MTGATSRMAWVLIGGLLGLVAVLFGLVGLRGDGSPAVLMFPLMVLIGGLVWAAMAPDGRAGARSGRDAAGRSAGTWIIAGGVVGFVAISAGLVIIGADVYVLALLLPFAVLCGGLLWAAQALLQTAGAPAAGRQAPGGLSQQFTSVGPPTTFSDPNAPDVPTYQAPPPPEPEGETVSEAVRAAAAVEFDLSRFLLDEPADRIQCRNCGRYTSLVEVDVQSVRCGACGTTGPSERSAPVRPDTRVRLFTDDPNGAPEAEPPVEEDLPTIGAGTSRFEPPSSHRGG